jgi:hypothetical protein
MEVSVTQQTIQTIASLAGAIGTVSAVILALFLQVFRRQHQKPELSLEFSPVLNDEDLALVDEDDQSLFVRLKV